MLFVDLRHEGGGWRESVIDEDKDSLLRFKLNSLADHVHELPDSKISRNQVLFLVNVCDVRSGCFLSDDRNAIRVLLKNNEARWKKIHTHTHTKHTHTKHTKHTLSTH